MTEESANQLLRILVRIFPYGQLHSDCLIWTDISSQQNYYGPNVSIETKAVKKCVKCNLMKLLSMKM